MKRVSPPPRSRRIALLAFGVTLLLFGTGCRYFCPAPRSATPPLEPQPRPRDAEPGPVDRESPPVANEPAPSTASEEPEPVARGNAFLAVGNIREADRAFAAQLRLHPGTTGAFEARFRQGLIRLMPDGPFYDPGRARQMLQALVDEAPQSTWAAQARALLKLQRDLDEAERRLEELKRIDLGGE